MSDSDTYRAIAELLLRQQPRMNDEMLGPRGPYAAFGEIGDAPDNFQQSNGDGLMRPTIDPNVMMQAMNPDQHMWSAGRIRNPSSLFGMSEEEIFNLRNMRPLGTNI